MAAVEVKVAGPVVKLRRPWVVGALSLIPFYWVFWYYSINREMRDFGRARDDTGLGESKPVLSVLAVMIGAIVVIPWVVSWLRTIDRIDDCERLAGARSEQSRLAVALMIAAACVPFISLFMTPGVAATVVSFSGLPAVLAATALLQGRLTRLWSVALS